MGRLTSLSDVSFVFVFVLIFAENKVTAHWTPCYEGINTTTCLNGTKDFLTNENKYWFGINYTVNCPQETPDPTCTNKDRTHYSIITRLRQSYDNSTDSITQILNVTYVSPAGSFEACGNTYKLDAAKTAINPVHVVHASSWSLKYPPIVSWIAESGAIYALVVWNVGRLSLQGFFINIRGSSLDQGETVLSYRGPQNPIARESPNIFALYKQSSALNLTSVRETVYKILVNKTEIITPADLFASISGITGPTGVSLVSNAADPFSVDLMRRNMVINNCPKLVTAVFAKFPLSYNVTFAQLSISVDVTYMTSDVNVQSCGENVTIQATSRMVNPIGNGPLPPIYTQNQPAVVLVQDKLWDPLYFFNTLYTLLMLDVTDEVQQIAQPNTLVHWQIINIREGQLPLGDVVKDYKYPLPVSGQHTYMFLLLSQSGVLNKTDLDRYASDTCSGGFDSRRCRFNMTAFITELKLTIVGASWFVSSPDAFSRLHAIHHGYISAAEACQNVTTPVSTPAPCPGLQVVTGGTSGSKVIATSLPSVLVLASVALVWSLQN